MPINLNSHLSCLVHQQNINIINSHNWTLGVPGNLYVDYANTCNLNLIIYVQLCQSVWTKIHSQHQLRLMRSNKVNGSKDWRRKPGVNFTNPLVRSANAPEHGILNKRYNLLSPTKLPTFLEVQTTRNHAKLLCHNALYQRCPTYSPLATCGEWRFKCGE